MFLQLHFLWSVTLWLLLKIYWLWFFIMFCTRFSLTLLTALQFRLTNILTLYLHLLIHILIIILLIYSVFTYDAFFIVSTLIVQTLWWNVHQSSVRIVWISASSSAGSVTWGERCLKALGDNAVRWCHKSTVVIYVIQFRD